MAADEALLDEIVARIVAAGDPERVVLFGSRARGDSTASSDYDLIVIEPSDEPGHRRAARYYRAIRRFVLPIDILVYTPPEVVAWADVPQSLVMTALREGRVLYERAN